MPASWLSCSVHESRESSHSVVYFEDIQREKESNPLLLSSGSSDIKQRKNVLGYDDHSTDQSCLLNYINLKTSDSETNTHPETKAKLPAPTQTGHHVGTTRHTDLSPRRAPFTKGERQRTRRRHARINRMTGANKGAFTGVTMEREKSRWATQRTL